VPDIDAVLERIDDISVPIINGAAMVGCSIGIVRDGELILARGYGFADVEDRRPVTPSTVFRIGSVSKTMTAIGVMQLVEQGRVDLDAPLSAYVRSFALKQPGGTRPATVRDVLTHTSGVGELRRLADLLQGGTIGLGVKHGEAIPSLADYYAAGLVAEVEPGVKWAYANHAIAALGQLIEDVTGQPFAGYMAEQVFSPLGMGTSDFLRSERVAAQLATGYVLKRGKVKAVPDMDIVVAAAGSVFSSTEDMAAYAAALMNGGANASGQVLKSDSLEEMYRPHWTADPRLPGQGLVFLLDEIAGRRIVGHDGGWPGFTSSMLVAPDDGLAVLAFTNSGSPAVHTLADTVLRQLLGAPALGEKPPHRPVPASPHLWEELTGVYAPPPGFLTNFRHWSTFGGELEVVSRGNRLLARTPLGPLRKGVDLHAVDPDDPLVFETVVDQQGMRLVLRLAFRRGDAGSVDEVAGQMLLPFRFRKRPRLRGARTLAGLGAGLAAAGLALSRRRRAVRS
jgi:CubicO group peptidase (beta-lactamase class C family)